MKKLPAMMMTMMMVLALTACGGDDSGAGDSGTAEGQAAANISIVMEIDYPDESGVADVEDVSVEIPEGASVMDALNTYADANDCEIVMDDSSDTPFVTSIGGVDMTDSAGWVYEVNDEMVMDTADQYILQAGDEVSWSFETWGE